MQRKAGEEGNACRERQDLHYNESKGSFFGDWDGEGNGTDLAWGLEQESKKNPKTKKGI